MWPARKDLGSQLTYGVYGNGLVVPAQSGQKYKPDVKFPRLRDSAAQFYSIQHSTIHLERATDQTFARHRARAPFKDWARALANSAFVPEALADGLATESQPLLEDISTDPTVGSLCAVVRLGTAVTLETMEGRDADGAPAAPAILKGIVYARERTLNVVPMLPKRRTLLGTGRRHDKIVVDTPNLSQGVSYELPFRVLQVEARKKLIAVRGAANVVFFKVSWSGAELTLRKVFEVSSDGAELSHVLLGDEQFVLLTLDGACSLYHLSKTSKDYGCKKARTVQIPPLSPHDLSAWRCVCWGHDSDAIVLTRKSVFKVSFSTKSSTRLVNAHLWSRMQDAVSLGNYIFLLTSQEVIWIETSKKLPFKRLVSWKHYLDTTDHTLKLAVCPSEDDSTFFCTVSSQFSPIYVIYTFGHSNGLPCSVRDPYIVHSGISNVHETRPFFSSFTHSPSMMNVVEVGTTGEVAVSYCCDTKAKSFRKVKETTSSTVSSNIHRVFTDLDFKHMYNLIVGDIRANRLSLSLLFDELQLAPEASQTDVVQDYAFKLGTNFRLKFPEEEDSQSSSFPSHSSVAEIALGAPVGVRDMEEFDSMIQQLEEFYNSEKLDLKRYTSALKFNTKDVSNVEIYDALENFHKLGRTEATMLLASSLIKAGRTDYREHCEQIAASEIEQCPDEVKNIFDDWKLPDLADEPLVEKTQIDTFDPLKSKQHLLHKAIAQNSQLRATQQETVIASLQPSQDTQPFDLGASQIVPLQIVPSQTQPRTQPKLQVKRPMSQNPSQKRKKKKGGFA